MSACSLFLQPIRNQLAELPEIRSKLKVYNGLADRCCPDNWLIHLEKMDSDYFIPPLCLCDCFKNSVSWRFFRNMLDFLAIVRTLFNKIEFGMDNGEL